MVLQILYRLLTPLALPLAKLYLKRRAKKQPAYLEHWDERFGTSPYPAPRGNRPRLWLHAVSLGETVAARPIIDAFLAEFPDADLLLTAMTPTGREAGAKIAAAYPGGRVAQCYLPYDTPALMASFLRQTRPAMGVVMETEVWPNMMDAARRAGVPMVLANARESEKSARQAARFSSVMQPAFAAFETVLAQSEADAQRLRALGARNVAVCGSVKFDIRPDGAQVRQAHALKEELGRETVLIASTRDGEEAELIAAVRAAPARALVVLVPRHPQRFDEAAELLARSGLKTVRRSCGPCCAQSLESADVLLGDTMGEMSFYCALADVCIMGGSFGNYGCQNLIEPAAAGVPVIVGPSSFNFAKAVDDAVAMGAAERVADAEQGWRRACQWLSDGALPERSRRAREFADAYTGATERQMQIMRGVWKKTL